MQWNPQQYDKFAAARAQPLIDLLALIQPAPRLRVVDLGCGPGALTARLGEALPEADVLGLDNSAEMLTAASSLERPGLRFELQTIEEFADAKDDGRRADFDLIFSNAALQWVSGHGALLPKLWARLRPGGQLAVQLPADDYNPARLVFADVAGWRYEMGTLDIAAYATLLHKLGAAEQVVYEKIYPHVLADADAVFEWARGTALLPYLARLPEAQRPRYLDDVRARLAEVYSERPVFFPFRRVVFWARRA